MKRYLVWVVIWTAPAAAQSLTAEQVLAKSSAAYASLKAIHVVAERDETSDMHGRPVSSSAECELAAGPGHRYYARFKLADVEGLAVSDGSTIWRALVSQKKWSKMTAAALEDTDAEEEGGKNSAKDLHGTMEDVLLNHFFALAKAAKEPALIKEEDYKVGHVKTRGYLVRAHTTAEFTFELLVDEQTFLVLRAKEQRKAPDGASEVVTRLKRLELSQPDDSLYTFTPQRSWHEVEMLILPGEQRMSLIGEHAANFTLKTLDGEAVALERLRGKVVVLDFWATWCPPCRAELPSVEKLRKEYGESVAFYGVNDEETSTVKKFVSQQKYEMPVLLDGRRDVHRQYGVRAIPTLLVIGPDGVIRQHFIGSRDESVLRKAIQSALKGNG